jgi:hypothetical protein
LEVEPEEEKEDDAEDDAEVIHDDVINPDVDEAVLKILK